MKNKTRADVRKFRGYAPERKVAGEGAMWKKVGVEKGFGPRHAENALEGEVVDPLAVPKLKFQTGSEAVPSELPSPPAEVADSRSILERWNAQKEARLAAGPSLKNILPGLVASIQEAGGQLAGMSKEEAVMLAISMMPGMGGEGPVGGFGKGGSGLGKVPRYEGPAPTKLKDISEMDVKQVKSQPSKYMEPLPPENEPIDPAVLEKYWADFEKQTGQKRPPEAMKRGKTKVGVAKGFGPRHAENAKEGVVPNTDTVPAMLTPREAVLNRNAAEMAGRGNIEKLNAEGNKLAKRGVDLAAEGDSDVGKAIASYAQNLTPEEMAKFMALLRGGRGVEEQPREVTAVPKYGEYHEELPDLGNPNRSKGDNDVKQKAKKYQGGGLVTQPAKLKGTYPVGNGMQPEPAVMPTGYGAVPGAGGPGVNPYNSIGGGVPNAMPPEQIGGMQGPQGSMWWQHKRNMAQQGPGLDWQHRRNMAINRGFDQPAMPLQGGGFYPRGAGIGLQGGAAEVPGIGAPNPQTAYGPPVQLRAGDVSKFLQQAGQQQGLSAGQISGLLKAFQGFGSGYNELTGGAGSAADMATAPTAGYAGGISDIGYPPFVAPSAEFHADKGGWLGPYDPAYTFQHYWRGTSDTTPPRLRSAERPFR